MNVKYCQFKSLFLCVLVSATNNRWWGHLFPGRTASWPSIHCSSVCCPSVYIYFICHDISVLSGGIPMKPATNMYHVSRSCWKGFQGQRSQVKVIAKTYALFPRRDGIPRWLTAIRPLSEWYFGAVIYHGNPKYHGNFDTVPPWHFPVRPVSMVWHRGSLVSFWTCSSVLRLLALL